MIKRFICVLHTPHPVTLISVLMGIISFSFVYQAFNGLANAGLRRRFTPRISVYKEYDDNIDLETYNKKYDWITMASPGFSLNMDSLKTKMSLDFETRFVFYEKYSNRDTILHNGTVYCEQSLTRNIKLDARDTFSRADDPIILSEEGVMEEVGERRIYYRNNGQIGLSLQFGADSSIGFGYRNLYLHYPDSKSADYEDRRGHEFFLNLNIGFISSFNIGLESRINRGRFIQARGYTEEFSEDFYDYEGAITLYYLWHPSRSLFARYSFLDKNFDEPDQGLNNMDFLIHQGSLGLNLALGPHTGFTAELGYFLQDFQDGRENGDLEKNGGSFNIVLNIQKRKASLSLIGNGGYAQDYFSSENLGSSKFKQVSGSVNYRLGENLRTSVSMNYRWNDFFGEGDRENRKDESWRTSAGFYFSYREWLSVSIEGIHSERESNDPEIEDFRDNRIMLRLAGAYPILF